MPQLNPEFYISQLFWLFVCFSFLIIFLWRISLPRISEVLDKRESKINTDIETAKKLQTEAEEIQIKIDKQLKSSKDETNNMVKKSLSKLNDKSLEELSKVDNEISAKMEESTILIQKNKKQALNEINDQIFEITKLTLSKLSSISINEKEIKDIIGKIKEEHVN